MSINEAIKLTREAGHVRRSHTNQISGTETISHHTFNMMNLVLLLNPDASNNLLKAIMWHDVPERYTGDIPSPAKQAFPKLGEASLDAEKQILKNYGLEVTLTENEEHWLKAIDKLDYMMWCDDQMNLGNNLVKKNREHVFNIINGSNNTPKEVKEFIKEYDSNPLPDISLRSIQINSIKGVSR